MSLFLVPELLKKKFPLDDIMARGRVSGIWGTLRAAFTAAVFLHTKKNVFTAFPSTDEAMRLHEDIRYFLDLGKAVSRVMDPSDMALRVPVIDALCRGKNTNIISGSYEALMKRTADVSSKSMVVAAGRTLGRDLLISTLADLGYKRVFSVESEGEFSVRGGIIDVHSPGSGPKRIELDADLVASLRDFDPYSQRSVSVSEPFRILPLIEDEHTDIFSLDKDAVVLVFPGPGEVQKKLAPGRKKVFATRFPAADSGIEIRSSMPEEFFGDSEKFLAGLAGKGSGVFVISKQSARLKELMADHPSDATVEHGELHEGFLLPECGISLYTDREIYGEQIPRRRFKAAEMPAGTRTDPGFKEGDHVVHKYYGIGVYRGICRQSASGVYSDYLFIQYDAGDCLYVPVNKMRLLSKYSAPADQPPRLSRLGTGEWSRLKKKVKKSIRDMTKELVKIYSSRRDIGGVAFPADSLWQKEFEDAFPYQETRDQAAAVQDVKKDMQSQRPMDRLICGDVGFGKTEVALRAAFKAVDAGKQVCLLVPTTILAEQHYLLFKERFAPFPFVVEMLSRFRDRKQQKDITEKVRAGAVDVLIGTHRLLQKDVAFKDLGLLIIDEEQRFGVTHKEKIKKFKNRVDVLSMSATPIPRTLYMALSGIWDMSVIETPPPGRSMVQTHVGPWNKKTVREAVERETERGGQVFYVHNRIESIAASVKMLSGLCPGLKIAGAHGRMDEKKLEEIMLDFSSGKYDVLVCTTIIESGLDMPNVNTIIIEDPQRMGLSTLYQLRGRVGRSDVKAYAYLLYGHGGSFTEKSMERLAAIKSFTELGSGQKIAMKDLEIRGAGNVLGAQQHGHMLAVGFDLYCEILKEASLEAKGEKPVHDRDPDIDLKVDAFLPDWYIEDEPERISLYKRMNSLDTAADRRALSEEMADRFGKLPPEAENLFMLIDLKIHAKEKGIERVRRRSGMVTVESKGEKRYLKVPEGSLKDLITQIKTL